MIHDLYTMRAMLGLPDAVVSAEIWRDGRAVTFTLEYPSGARCVATWIDLPDLWDFKETLEIYGDDQRAGPRYLIVSLISFGNLQRSHRGSRTDPKAQPLRLDFC